MKKTSKTIVFFGNERLATGVGTPTPTPVLKGLVDNGYKVKRVIVAQNYDVQSRKRRGLEIAAVARDYGIPILQLEQSLRGSSDTIISREDLRNLKADIGVLVAYGNIVPQEIIDMFPKGIVNIHPSLLPKHRGSTPIESVILNGEHITGVSLMALSAKMDAGPVYAQEKVVLIGNETKQDLVRKFTKIGRDLLLANLPAILDGSLKPQPQDDSQATYDQRITKEDGVIDWQKPALRLEREVRAYAGWPRSRTRIGDKEVVVTKAHVIKGDGEPGTIWRQGKSFGIYTAEGILLIDALIPAGKKEMSAEAFLAGYQV